MKVISYLSIPQARDTSPLENIKLQFLTMLFSSHVEKILDIICRIEVGWLV